MRTYKNLHFHQALKHLRILTRSIPVISTSGFNSNMRFDVAVPAPCASSFTMLLSIDVNSSSIHHRLQCTLFDQMWSIIASQSMPLAVKAIFIFILYVSNFIFPKFFQEWIMCFVFNYGLSKRHCFGETLIVGQINRCSIPSSFKNCLILLIFILISALLMMHPALILNFFTN